MSMKLSKAFTLIELLIVIIIIGILATSLLPRITGIQAKARDTKRLADMKTIQTALEMYYMDHGRYPAGGYWVSNNVSDYGERANLENALGMSLPTDPSGDTRRPATTAMGGSGYAYAYIASNNANFCYGGGYLLIYKKEKGECDNIVSTPVCPGGYTPPSNLGKGVCILRPNHWAK